MFSSGEKEFVTWAKARNMIILILIVGLIIRFVLMPISASPQDIAVWAAFNDSIFSGDTIYEAGRNWYPPIWGYFLSVIGAFTNLAGMGSFGDVFTTVYTGSPLVLQYGFLTNLSYTAIVKIPAVIFDILGALGAYLLVKKLTGDQKKAVIGFALWFLAPVVIMSSSVLNMFDSIMVTLMIFSLLTFMNRKYLLAGMLLALAVYTKMFAAVLIPIMIAYLISEREITPNERVKNILIAIAGFLIVTAIVYLPTILGGEFSDSINFFTARHESYSGFSTGGGLGNFFFYIPILAVAYTAIFAIMFLRKTEREKTFLWLTVVSIVLIFSLPLVSYTPTYGITMLPAILILYSLKGKIALIPWALTILFPIHGMLHYMGTLLYPLGAAGAVNFADVSLLVHSTIYNLVLIAMPIAGMSVIAIFVYYLTMKKKEVKNWKSILIGSE